MAQKAIPGSEALARQIRLRRNELGLTIEEAATRAGIGTKTWCRYEAGESIRWDKGRGVCKALNWSSLPDDSGADDRITVEEFRDHKAWSRYLEDVFGPKAAMSFAAGSDILSDHIREDLNELAGMPKGSHIGQLGVSWLKDELPEQFLMNYDYNFLFQMQCVLQAMRGSAGIGTDMVAHSVLEELILYLCNEQAKALLELSLGPEEAEEINCEDWVFDLFGDMDLITFLYSGLYLQPEHPYHFSHWSDMQFYIDSEDPQ